MAQQFKKPNAPLDARMDESIIIGYMTPEMIDAFFKECEEEKKTNPFFGAYLFYASDAKSLLPRKSSARINGLVMDLEGTLGSMRVLFNNLFEELSDLNGDIVPSIAPWALLQWDVEPVEIPIYDRMPLDFMSKLYDTVNADTLNYLNTQLFAAKHIAESILIQLPVEYNQLFHKNEYTVLKKSLELI